MVKVDRGNLDQALGIFAKQCEQVLKESKKNMHFSPEPNRQHHRGKTYAGRKRAEKPQGRRRY